METIKIGKYDVNKEDVLLYIHHFGKDKTNISEWETLRQALHNNIFDNLGINRHSELGQNFSKQLDEYCEPQMIRFDAITVKAKKLINAKTDSEIENAQMGLRMEMQTEMMKRERGIRNFKLDDKSECRVCKTDLSSGGGRTNDHLASVNGFEEVNKPICMKCSKEKPDEYHLAFKEQYWNKER